MYFLPLPEGVLEMNKKSPNQIRPMLSIAFYSAKALFRNRATVFFGFAFPLMFISVFGLFGNQSLSIDIGIAKDQQKGPIYEELSSIEAVSIESNGIDGLKNKLSQGRIGGVLDLENPDSPKLFVSQADPQQTAAVTSLVSGVVDKLNLKLTSIEDPPFKLQTEEISGREFRFIDFFLPGMIGFALLSTSITSVALGSFILKKP